MYLCNSITRNIEELAVCMQVGTSVGPLHRGHPVVIKNKSLYFRQTQIRYFLFRKMTTYFGLCDHHLVIITKILKITCHTVQIMRSYMT